MNNMHEEEIRDHLSLVRIPQIGDVHIPQLIRIAGSAGALFRMRRKELESIAGIGAARASAILGFRDHARSEQEMRYAKQQGINIIIRGTPEYPERLNHCHDAPHVLFFKGSLPLDQTRVLSVVGTRSPTTYGKERTQELMAALTAENVLVVSGLAYGVDTIAHREAVTLGMATVGVLAHGLDKIYPQVNRPLAMSMLNNGGLLTECWKGTQPDRQNFPRRNRIVAGLADAVVVVESGEKGGSLITADIANSYNRDVFVFPGRASDLQSRGCNELIRTHQAQLISCGRDLLEAMNWQSVPQEKQIKQVSLFPELSDAEQEIFQLFRDGEAKSVDVLQRLSGSSPASLSAILLSLELKGLLQILPGNRYLTVTP